MFICWWYKKYNAISPPTPCLHPTPLEKWGIIGEQTEAWLTQFISGRKLSVNSQEIRSAELSYSQLTSCRFQQLQTDLADFFQNIVDVLGCATPPHLPERSQDKKRFKFLHITYRQIYTISNITWLPSVNTLTARGMFCGAKYTHHTFTPIIKHLIATTENKHPGKKSFIDKKIYIYMIAN